MSPFHWFKRPWRTFTLLPLMVLALTVCKSKQKGAEEPPPAAADTKVAVKETVLVDDGDNSQPSYSPAGDRLLFVSGKRPSHAQPQVYERDLKSGTDRRITFQSGATWSPRYHPKEKLILYSSSTDELKENSPLLAGTEIKPSKLPPPLNEPLEVYVHGLTGLEIRRLTTRPGFDGDARFTPDGKHVAFTKVANDKSQIAMLPLAGGPAKNLHGLGINPASYVTTPDGKATAWIDWDDSYGVSRLRLKSGKETVDVAPDMIVTKTDPEFSPDGKWLLWAQKDPQSGLFGIWGYDLTARCLHRFVFPSEGERRYPAVSPDMKTLTYTVVRGGRGRIAQVPFEAGSGPCPVPPQAARF